MYREKEEKSLEMLGEKRKKSGKEKRHLKNIFLSTKQFVSLLFCGSSDSVQETW